MALRKPLLLCASVFSFVKWANKGERTTGLLEGLKEYKDVILHQFLSHRLWLLLSFLGGGVDKGAGGNPPSAKTPQDQCLHISFPWAAERSQESWTCLLASQVSSQSGVSYSLPKRKLGVGPSAPL